MSEAGGEQRDGDEAGGDEVCWLHRLCPECGAMPSRTELPGDGPERCWRCGAHVVMDSPDGSTQPESR